MAYYLIKPLPSSSLERKLLSDLEKYVKRTVNHFASLNGEPHNINYVFKIEEATSTETFQSIENFSRVYFPNNVQSIKMKCEGGINKNITVDVFFSAEKTLTGVEIRCEGDFAREIANGL